jgi:hypothetical protein
VPASPEVVTSLDRIRPWLTRLVWALLVLTLGLGIGSALSTHSRPVQSVGTLLAWGGWTLGLLALAVAHPIGLTTLRLCLVAVVGTTAWVALSTPVPSWQRMLAVLGCIGCLGLVGSAETATWCVDGPSYPGESRHALRTPPWLIPLSTLLCVLTVGLVIAAPLLLASKAWLAGGVVAVAAAGMLWVGTRSIHQLSVRFVVFVPAGFVVHDALSLLDPVLFRRNVIERIAAAPADTDSLDLTSGAIGMPLEVMLTEKVELTKLSADRKTGEAGRTARFLVSPVRPGAVVREAAARRLPVA